MSEVQNSSKKPKSKKVLKQGSVKKFKKTISKGLKKARSLNRKKAGAELKKLIAKPKKSLKKAQARVIKAVPSKEKISEILTENPFGKKGVKMAVDQYEKIRKGILEAIYHLETPTQEELVGYVKKKWGSTILGSVDWAAEAVKLDLEARKLIKRLMGKPERYSKDTSQQDPLV